MLSVPLKGTVVNPVLSSLYGGSHEIMLSVPLKGTVVNPVLPSLYGGSLEIMLTVPLKDTVVNPVLPSLYGGSLEIIINLKRKLKEKDSIKETQYITSQIETIKALSFARTFILHDYKKYKLRINRS